MGGKHQKKKKVESQSVFSSEFSIAEKASRLSEWDSSYSVAILLLDLEKDTKWETPSWCNAAEKLSLYRDLFSLPKVLNTVKTDLAQKKLTRTCKKVKQCKCSKHSLCGKPSVFF